MLGRGASRHVGRLTHHTRAVSGTSSEVDRFHVTINSVAQASVYAS